jgi:DNA-binding GntR family transcriptional regulator
MHRFDYPIFKDYQSLTHRVTDYLESLIIKGVLRPGERLVETMLANGFKISRGPIREAFRILEGDGLLVTIPRKGTFVAEITTKGVRDICSIRAALEALAVRLSVPVFGKSDFKKIQDLDEKTEEARRKNDMDRYSDLTDEFHNCFIYGNDNEKLQSTYKSFAKQIARFRKIVLSSEHCVVQSLHEHHQITSAVLNKDVDLAERLIKSHVESSGNRLLELLTKDKQLLRAAPSGQEVILPKSPPLGPDASDKR